MNKRIFSFEQNEKLVLGFDTGLDPQSFARAKMFHLITEPGLLVYPDGRVELWQPGGVAEYPPGSPADENHPASSMTVWGPIFPGENLIDIINSSQKEDALDALRYWLKAGITLVPGDGELLNSPAGAFIVSRENENVEFPFGTVFFPPARLLIRCLEAEGNDALLEAERWSPDGNLASQGMSAGLSFCAAAMLYRIFCNAPPFGHCDRDELRRDIREAVFLPPNLASPGLDPQLAELISRSLNAKSPNAAGGAAGNTASADLYRLIGPPSSRAYSSWINPLSSEEILKIETAKEQYSKKKNFTVKVRRFIIRNTAAIIAVIAVFLVLLFAAREIIASRRELPMTKGMDPIEVARSYYGAFGNLDHALMEACVIGGAGKDDITMVMNLFVISRVRGAYEASMDLYISAEDWIREGSPPTDRMVFGVTDLELSGFGGNKEAAQLKANYILWMPDDKAVINDKLEFIFQKGAWRISKIERTR